ncbi:hypothetical protein ScPMuIL_011796 [Solemya velum]
MWNLNTILFILLSLNLGVTVGNDCEGFTLTSVVSVCKMRVFIEVSPYCMGLELSQVRDTDSCWCYIQPQTEKTLISVTTSNGPGYVGCGTNILITGPSTSILGGCHGLSYISGYLSPEQTVSIHVNQSTPGQSTGNEYCLRVCPEAAAGLKMTCCSPGVQDCYKPTAVDDVLTTTTESASDVTMSSVVSKIDSTSTAVPKTTTSVTEATVITSPAKPMPSTESLCNDGSNSHWEIIFGATGWAILGVVVVSILVCVIRKRKMKKDGEHGNHANNSTDYGNLDTISRDENAYQSLEVVHPNHSRVEDTGVI